MAEDTQNEFIYSNTSVFMARRCWLSGGLTYHLVCGCNHSGYIGGGKSLLLFLESFFVLVLSLYTYSFIHLSIYLSVAITSFVVKFTHRCLQNAGSVYLSFKLLYTIVYLFSIFCIPKNILGHYRTCQRSRKSWGCYSSDAFVKCYHNIPRNVPYAVMTGSYKYKFTYQLGIYM